jgi:hypothetical protein
LITEIPDGVIFNAQTKFQDCDSLTKISESVIFNSGVEFYNIPLTEIPEKVLKNSHGKIYLPFRLKEKYSKFPNVRFA